MNIYNSFVAVPIEASAKLFSLSQQIYSAHCLVNTEYWQFLFKGLSLASKDKLHYANQSKDYFFIGDIYNQKELKILLAKYSSNALSCPLPELLYLLLVFLGKAAFSLIEGPFTFIVTSGKELTIINDSLGFLPVNLISGSHLWISSELKTVAKIENLNFYELEKINKVLLKPDNFLPIKNAIRIKPGHHTTIKFDGSNHHYLNSISYCSLALGNDQKVHQKEASEIVFHLLENSILNHIDNESHISLPLSGGVDSSLVAAFVSQNTKQLSTYSIGSNESNEFAYSSMVAKHLNTQHEEFILSDQDILSGLIDSIYHNEIFDGLSAEIQSGLFNLYRLDRGKSSAMLTGYGADLIFGGVLEGTYPLEQVNNQLWKEIYRTRWTGEFSYFGALHYGIKIKHPFWNLKLLSYCLNLDPSLKLAKGEVKFFIRAHAEKLNVLPKEIVWRKKLGIHEGSSKNKIIARMLGTETSNYQAKTQFTYALYQEFLTTELKPHEIDLEKYKLTL